MRANHLALAAIAVGITGLACGSAAAQTVKVTPLGSHDGEFCRFDRAMVLEDPDGTRILYDAGRTVAGPDDPRLGKIDAVLLSHVHRDHLGERHVPAPNAGECGKPDASVGAAPNSNVVNIAMGKKARFIVGAEMSGFFAAKIKTLGGDAKLVQPAPFGLARTVGGVSVTSVPAVHSNGVHPAFLDDKEHAAMLKAQGLTAYAGPPTGFVVTFSNGLTAYLSGDTGPTAEQDLVVRRYYGAKLAVINIGGGNAGPAEAAHVVNEMVQPASVIPSHANQATTEGGKLIAGTRTDKFIKAVKGVPVYLPLSGRTMEFDGSGKCVGGC